MRMEKASCCSSQAKLTFQGQHQAIEARLGGRRGLGPRQAVETPTFPPGTETDVAGGPLLSH